jgi:hypothetical protein
LFQALAGFQREAEFSRAAHIMGLQAASQRQASMRILQAALGRASGSELLPMLSAMINTGKPEHPDALSLTASGNLRLRQPGKLVEYLAGWKEVEENLEAARRNAKETRFLTDALRKARREAYEKERVLREKLISEGKRSNQDRLPVSVLPS